MLLDQLHLPGRLGGELRPCLGRHAPHRIRIVLRVCTRRVTDSRDIGEVLRMPPSIRRNIAPLATPEVWSHVCTASTGRRRAPRGIAISMTACGSASPAARPTKGALASMPAALCRHAIAAHLRPMKKA
jgi:hypothetical protein